MKCVWGLMGMFWMVGAAMAAEPITTCPPGYVGIIESDMIISDGACPAGYSSAGDADSCLLASPGGSCIMFVPADIPYSDVNGTWVFEQACLLS
ncbi:MAG: hypothetical protein K2L95_01835 [Alphaproteobacteria bacterium]|nr:hypothetical protein [Alphaproteobacteria bacterium]